MVTIRSSSSEVISPALERGTDQYHRALPRGLFQGSVLLSHATVANDGKNPPLVQVDIGLLTDQVGVSTADTLDLGQGVHDLLLSIDVRIEESKDELEVRLLSSNESYSSRQWCLRRKLQGSKNTILTHDVRCFSGLMVMAVEEDVLFKLKRRSARGTSVCACSRIFLFGTRPTFHPLDFKPPPPPLFSSSFISRPTILTYLLYRFKAASSPALF